MKTTLYFAATTLIATLIISTVVDGQLSQDQGTLLVVESPNLFAVSPTGGELRKVPLAKPIISVGGISGKRQIVVATRDEKGTPVVEKLLLPGEVLGRYPKPPGSFPSSFSPDGMFLLYQNITEGTLILHHIEKNVGRKLFDVDEWERVAHPVMSPNGTLVAFSLFITGSPSVISRVCLLHVNEAFQRDRCIGERAMLPAFSLTALNWLIGSKQSRLQILPGALLFARYRRLGIGEPVILSYRGTCRERMKIEELDRLTGRQIPNG